MGTEWAIRLLDTEAREIWSVDLSAVAWAVNISRNGRLAVAALSDGTVRWYRMADGQEVLSYFPHANGTDWIAWLPSGYYLSSLFGDTYIGWHINRDKSQAPDFHRAVQFDRILYRPDIVRTEVATYLTAPTRALAKPYALDGIKDRFDSGHPETAAPRLFPDQGIDDGRLILFRHVLQQFRLQPEHCRTTLTGQHHHLVRLRLVSKYASRRQENKGEDQRHHHVILQAPSLEVPEDPPFY